MRSSGPALVVVTSYASRPGEYATGVTVTPSPHHPFGAKGVGESATVGAPPAIANAVVDALSHLGVRHIDMPVTRDKVWRAIRDAETRKAAS